jgi:hypothetical protein
MPIRVVHPLCRRGVLALAAIGLTLLVGCSAAEEIRSYDAKREKTDATGPDKERLLGAIIPVGEDTSLFVKFSGPIDQIAPHEKVFDDFVASIRVEAGGKNPKFTAPPGWKDTGARQLRLATFLPPGDAKDPPQLYISTPFGGTLLANVNRWRDEVGIPNATQSELPKVTTEIKVGDIKAYKVDFKGPGGKKKMPPIARG